MISLRLATMDDANVLLSWRNEPVTVALSSTPDRCVTIEEHARWLTGKLNDCGCQLFIAYDERGDLGMVRFDDMDDHAGVVEISIAVAPEHRGKGCAKAIIRAACDALSCLIVANIKRSNIPSRRAFEACGFILCEVNWDEHMLQYERSAIKSEVAA